MAGSEPVSPRSRREKLGEFVRIARKDREMSQARLGKLIRGSQAKINRIERGLAGTKIDDLRAIVTALGIPPEVAAEMEALAAAAPRQRTWRGAIPLHVRRYLEAEREAVLIRGVHGDRIPGVLQSEQYMFRQAGIRNPAQITDRIRARLERKQLFDLDGGPRFEYLLSESSVRRRVHGSVAVALDQVAELLRIGDRYPGVSIHVLPFDADIDFLPGDFTLLDFADRARNFVYIELMGRSVEPRGTAEITRYRHQWDKLRQAALSRADTRVFLTDLYKELDA
ncbi:helix-turn-helix domain-containing protein [Lentzea sp. NPDC004789]